MNPIRMEVNNNWFNLIKVNKISAFIKSELINKYSNKNIIIFYEDKTIKIKTETAIKISLKKFSEYEKQHGITSEDREAFWPEIKTFFLYPFVVVENIKEKDIYIEKKEVSKPLIKSENKIEEDDFDIPVRKVREEVITDGRRLSDYIPEMTEEEISKVLIEGIPEEVFEVDESDNQESPENNIRYSRNEHLNKLRQQSSRIKIEEPNFVKDIRKEIKELDLLERFKAKLQGK